MKLIIHSRHLRVPSNLAEFLAKHLSRPLARVFDDSAAELVVYLGDQRPRKGGTGQECRIAFRMPGASPLNVVSIQDDLYKALLDASERLRRAVRKQLGRMRSPTRRPVHRPLGRTYRETSTRSGVTPEGDPAAL